MPVTQNISELDEALSTELDRQRAWVAERLDRDALNGNDPSDAATQLRLIDAALEGGLTRDDTWELQALGVAFGDALARRLGVDWVAVDDEYGHDPALLAAPGPVLVFPRTIISKRVQRGERVRAMELFLNVCRGLSAHV